MELTDIQRHFVLHWGEMGSLWGVNRTVSQIHALLFVVGKPMNAEQLSETLAVARRKPMPQGVQFAISDAYTLHGLPARRFDAAFAGFWWSHVPVERLPSWLALLHARLQPGACVVMLDNRWVEGSSTPISRRDAAGNGYQQRRLDDGSVHEVLKNFPIRDEVLALLGAAAHHAAWTDHRHYWTLRYQLA